MRHILFGAVCICGFIITFVYWGTFPELSQMQVFFVFMAYLCSNDYCNLNLHSDRKRK